jgi:hypothetical protein
MELRPLALTPCPVLSAPSSIFLSTTGSSVGRWRILEGRIGRADFHHDGTTTRICREEAREGRKRLNRRWTQMDADFGWPWTFDLGSKIRRGEFSPSAWLTVEILIAENQTVAAEIVDGRGFCITYHIE